MHRAAALFGIGTVALGCVGNIGEGANPAGGAEGTPPVTTSAEFVCDQDAARLIPTTIKRLARVYVENALIEMLSQFDAGPKDALMAALRTRLDLVPVDASDYYAKNDDRVTQDHVDAMFGLAAGMAAQLVDDVEGCASQMVKVCGGGGKQALQDEACLSTFVAYYGRKAFRRPLSASEIEDFAGYYRDTMNAGVDGFASLVARFVAHPNFYYRFDSDGPLVEGAPEGEVHRLTRWELLSKITFLFWASPPTDELYDRVEQTDITEDGALEALLQDVLSDAKAERGLLGFYRDWLQLDKTKNPGTDGNTAAAQAMVAAAGLESLPASHREDMIVEVLELAKHYTLTTEGNLQDILTSPHSFATSPALAAIYGVEPWSGDAEALVSFPAGERSGLLSRAALLASNTEHTHPILKGKVVRTRLLCQDIPSPPADLDIQPLVYTPDLTTRESVEMATADAKCRACHQFMNPYGFSSERFDPIGRRRDTELHFAEATADVVSELDIDDRVTVPALGDGDSTTVEGVVELAEVLADSEEVPSCMVKNYFQFVNGRAEDPDADGCDLVAMREQLTSSDGSIKTMLVRGAMLPSFRVRLLK